MSEFNTPNYTEQGGAKDIVGNGGELEVQSGGTLDIQSGATFTNAATQTQSGTVTQTGVTTLSGDGTVNAAVTAGTTAAVGVIKPHGIATMASTGKAETFLMTGAPTVGNVLTVQCNTATSTGTCTLKAAAGVTFTSTGALRTLVFGASNSSAILTAVSATQYAVIPNSTADVVPTST